MRAWHAWRNDSCDIDGARGKETQGLAAMKCFKGLIECWCAIYRVSACCCKFSYSDEKTNTYLHHAVDRLPLRLRLRGRVARIVDLGQVPSPPCKGAHVTLLPRGPKATYIADVEIVCGSAASGSQDLD